MKLKYSILFSTLALSAFGIIMIYSASSYSAAREFGDAFYYVKKQALAFLAGTVMLFFGCKLKPEVLKRIKWIILFVSVGLLAVVFIPGVGVSSYGATRWISLGFMTLQPSEFAKFGLVIFLAGYLSEHPPHSLKKMIVPLLCGGCVCVLIMLEPNMSITMCVGLALIIVMYAAGTPSKWFVTLLILLVAAVPILIFAEPYRIKRLLAFIDPWQNPKAEGYQLIQSYYAVGSGGLFGVGLFNSRQKYLFLPFAESDFIFSVIAEELGLFGAIGVICVFLVLIYSGIKTALRASNSYERLLATGIAALNGVQTAINVAVVTGAIPPTGLPLPYISAGGTALMSFMFASGLLINIAKKEESALPKKTTREVKTVRTLKKISRHRM